MRRTIGTLAVVALLASAIEAGAVEQWRPEPGVTWQIQLQGRPDLSIDAQVYELDGFDVSEEKVAALHDAGRRVICYMNGGAWEDWRPDADDFPEEVKGKELEGWPGERWLDVGRLDLLQPIMEARLDICVEKGFDAVDFDNVDGYTQDSGFDISWDDQIAYNRWLAQAAEDRGLAAGLKNDLEQVPELVGDYEFSVNEQCFLYRECKLLKPFIDANKPVLNIEYELARRRFCP
ncbi:MAG TPA: endo alpha-1,4 polygalactosaminidase, partial [Actinomycetota bacterium]|nr:endo alpha-1,4 polygalactosaminidase [Actinomycetota bacterium]